MPALPLMDIPENFLSFFWRAAALVAAQCAKVAEAAGATRDQVAAAVRAAVAATDASNVITLTAAAATCKSSRPARDMFETRTKIIFLTGFCVNLIDSAAWRGGPAGSARRQRAAWAERTR